MKDFVARNAKQLDICLRMLYAENVDFLVRVYEDDKRKIRYAVKADTDEETRIRLAEKYRILIS